MTRRRVLLVTDSTAVRLGFEALAGGTLHFEDCPSEPSEAVDRARKGTYDLVVVDEPSDGRGTVSLCATLVETSPATPVMVLAGTLDGNFVRSILEAGVRGLVGRDESREQLLSALDWVMSGHAVLDPRVTTKLLSWIASNEEDDDDGLSEREVDVLKLVTAGESNKRIARRMGVTENTVKTYLRRAFRKLGCTTRSAAAAAAIKRGWI